MDRWWNVVVPEDAQEVELPGDARARNDLAARLHRLEHGALVAVVGDQAGSWWGMRVLLGRAGLRLEREYLALPGLDSPGYLVEADHASFRHFFSQLLYMPSGGWVKVSQARLLARVASMPVLWRVGAWLAPSRLAIARRA